MRDLKVSLDYRATEGTPVSSASPLALPLRVLDAEGGLLAEGVAASSRPAQFQIPDTEGPIFVRLTWPSGKTETKKATSDSITFDDGEISRNEWSAWAAPLLNRNTPLASSELPRPDQRIDRFNGTWLRLWRLRNGYWSDVVIAPTDKRRNELVVQLDLALDQNGWCLQLGGADLPWRMVSLPGGGPCRVLITPNDSDDPRAEPLKVVVTGFRRDAETLLEFLSRDALRAASAVAKFNPVAVQLLEGKFKDPVAAVAGAYFLLRTQSWSSIPLWWFDNLCNEFPWLPDGAIIRCAVLVRGGLAGKKDEAAARKLLKESLHRGFPIFAEGLSLLQEVTSLLHRRADRGAVFTTVEKLVTSQAWAGAVLSYYGEEPDSPSPTRVFGVPRGKSRAHRSMRAGAPIRAVVPPPSVLLLENVR